MLFFAIINYDRLVSIGARDAEEKTSEKVPPGKRYVVSVRCPGELS